MPDFKNKTWILGDFIKFVQEKKDRSIKYDAHYDYCIYASDVEDRLYSEMIIYVGNTSEFDENDKEIFPSEVIKMNFWFEYSCENFQDVIDLATKQNATISVQKIIECLNYYNEHDTFLDVI